MARKPDDLHVREILAATEEVARTLLGNVVDSLATTADERTMKWTESADALAHLARLREAVNSGEDLVWATVDFYISVIEQQQDGIPVRAFVAPEVYDSLEEQGQALGMTAQGFLTALAMKAAKDHVAQKALHLVPRKKALIVATDGSRAEKFIRSNSEAFAGWEVTAVRSGTDGNDLRGRQFHLTVLLDPITTQPLRQNVAACTRLGDTPAIVKASLIDKFDPNAAIEMERTQRIIDGHG